MTKNGIIPVKDCNLETLKTYTQGRLVTCLVVFIGRCEHILQRDGVVTKVKTLPYQAKVDDVSNSDSTASDSVDPEALQNKKLVQAFGKNAVNEKPKSVSSRFFIFGKEEYLHR